MENKRGWIRIFEAIIAILLVAGVSLVVLNNIDNQRSFSNTIHEIEIGILRYVQLNDTFRGEILLTGGKILWDDFSSAIPKTRTGIESLTPGNLECVAQLCEPSDPCFLADIEQKEVFAESVLISSNLDTFNPRILKLFCWERLI